MPLGAILVYEFIHLPLRKDNMESKNFCEILDVELKGNCGTSHSKDWAL